MNYPPVDLCYLRSLTDCTGVIQHGFHSVPNRKLGYTSDDNARALIVAANHYGRTGDEADLRLAITYLSFLHYAQSPDFRFRNFMTYTRAFLDDEGTEDCFGRVMWACGYAASSKLPENVRIVAAKMLKESIVWADTLQSPRAKAYTLLGIRYFLRRHEDAPGLIEKARALGESLLAGLKTYGDSEWHWYEPYLTYGNAILPLGMLAAHEITERKDFGQAAVRTLGFLTDVLIPDGRLEVIGNDGWYVRGGKRAWYDQQSIDAGYTVYAYAKACEILRDKQYAELAKIAHSWFFGKNRSAVPVYDPETGGCYDAIMPGGVNLNQGSESTICFLLAHLAMEELEERISGDRRERLEEVR